MGDRLPDPSHSEDPQDLPGQLPADQADGGVWAH